ncbi:MAG: hypothetical protein KR126chlam1_00801 [Chlamydiae bacterium]|nr:hypothetical protein [Chlamydiota bacterium]
MSVSTIAPSPIANFIEDSLISGEANQITKGRLIARRSLQGLGLIPIIVGRIGMVMICLNGAAAILNVKKNSAAALALGIPSAIGASVTFGVFSIFNTFSLIERLTKKTTDQEKQIFTKKISQWQSTAIATSSVIIGLIAHVALAYAAYNSADFAPVIMYLGQQLDFGRAANSTFLTLMDVFSKEIPYTTELELELKKSKSRFCSKISDFKKHLAYEDKEFESKFSRFFAQVATEKSELLMHVPSSTNGHHSSSNYISMILEGAQSLRHKEKPLSERQIFWCHAITTLSAVGIYAEFFALGSAGARAAWDKPGFYHTAGAVVLCANAYIWGTLIKKCSYVCTNFVRKELPKSIEGYLRPKLHSWMTGIGFVLAAPVFVPQMFFAKAYLPAPYYYPIGIAASVAGLLGGFATALAMRDRLIRYMHSKHPRIKLDDQLNRLNDLITGAGPLEIAKFMATLPQEMRATLSCPPLGNMQQYIQANTEKTQPEAEEGLTQLNY